MTIKTLHVPGSYIVAKIDGDNHIMILRRWTYRDTSTRERARRQAYRYARALVQIGDLDPSAFDGDRWPLLSEEN